MTLVALKEQLREWFADDDGRIRWGALAPALALLMAVMGAAAATMLWTPATSPEVASALSWAAAAAKRHDLGPARAISDPPRITKLSGEDSLSMVHWSRRRKSPAGSAGATDATGAPVGAQAEAPDPDDGPDPDDPDAPADPDVAPADWESHLAQHPASPTAPKASAAGAAGAAAPSSAAPAVRDSRADAAASLSAAAQRTFRAVQSGQLAAAGSIARGALAANHINVPAASAVGRVPSGNEADDGGTSDESGEARPALIGRAGDRGREHAIGGAGTGMAPGPVGLRAGAKDKAPGANPSLSSGGGGGGGGGGGSPVSSGGGGAPATQQAPKKNPPAASTDPATQTAPAANPPAAKKRRRRAGGSLAPQ